MAKAMAIRENTLQPGTIAHRAVAYLRECDYAMRSPELADALGIDRPQDLIDAMMAAVAAGIVEASKSVSGHIVWSLVPNPPEEIHEKESRPKTPAAVRNEELLAKNKAKADAEAARMLEARMQKLGNERSTLLDGRSESDYQKIDRIIELIGVMEDLERLRTKPNRYVALKVAKHVESERMVAFNEIRRLLGDDRCIRIQPK